MKMKKTYVRSLLMFLFFTLFSVFFSVWALSPHVYTVSGSATVSGYAVSLVGTASANSYVGGYDDQKISIDWENDGSWDTTLWVDDFGLSSPGKVFFINWSSSHTYTSPGSYVIRVKLYHGNIVGAEASESSTITINIVVGPPLDTTAPTLLVSDVVPGQNDVSMSILSNETSTGHVLYGLTNSYGSISPIMYFVGGVPYAKYIAGLLCGTDYHYQVYAVDAVGNTGSTSDASFTTLACPDLTAPVVSVTALVAYQDSADITIQSNEDALGWIEYGLDSNYGSGTSPLSLSAGIDQLQSLPELQCGMIYHFKVFAIDTAGNTGSTSDATFMTISCPDVSTPYLSVTSVVVGQTNADISYVSDEDGSGWINYGFTTAYGSGTEQVPLSANIPVTQSLSCLQCGTTYHYQVTAVDISSNSVTTTDASFTTLACPDILAPVILMSGSVVPAQTSADIIYSVNETATGWISYGTTTSYGSTTAMIPLSSGLFIGQTLSPLFCNTLYHYQIYAVDAVGNTGNTSDSTFTTLACSEGPDLVPPLLTGSVVPAQYSALVSYMSDELGTGWIVYGSTTGYGAQTLAIPLVASSGVQQSLGELSCNTVYHYQIYAVDIVGNTGNTNDSIFTTLACGSEIGDVVAPLLTGNVVPTQTSAIISFSSNENGSGWIVYGPTTGYGNQTLLTGLLAGTGVGQTIPGLVCGANYHYQIYAVDAAGNTGSTSDAIFTTLACTQSSGGGGGGGGSMLTLDVCPVGDFSPSYYDRSCGIGSTSGGGSSLLNNPLAIDSFPVTTGNPIVLTPTTPLPAQQTVIPAVLPTELLATGAPEDLVNNIESESGIAIPSEFILPPELLTTGPLEDTTALCTLKGAFSSYRFWILFFLLGLMSGALLEKIRQQNNRHHSGRT